MPLWLGNAVSMISIHYRVPNYVRNKWLYYFCFSSVISKLSKISAIFIYLIWSTLPIIFSTVIFFTVGRWMWVFFIVSCCSSKYKHILLCSFLAANVGSMQWSSLLDYFVALKFIMCIGSSRKYFWNTHRKGNMPRWNIKWCSSILQQIHF